MTAIVTVEGLSKTYKGGFAALKSVSLRIEQGEILATSFGWGLGLALLLQSGYPNNLDPGPFVWPGPW